MADAATPAKVCTLLFLRRDNQLLLAMKKRGFGSGRYNGVGGKIEPGETIEQAAVRECQEEIEVTPAHLEKVAYLEFSFPDGTTDMIGHVFICDTWQGEPTETEEMAPQWFDETEIPYAQMWQDDIIWLPAVLQGKKLRCNFTFDEHDNMLSGSFEIVQSLN